MSRIKTVIVDDELLARRRIRKLLSADPEIHIVAEFSTGVESIDFISSHAVDLLFLDIHMPELNGFAVLRNLNPSKRPFVIFATADKESAIKAFEYQALDYLLKPFRSERFYNALMNAKAYVQLKNKAKLGEQVVGLLNSFQESKHKASIETTTGKKLDLDDCLYVKSDGNYLRLYKNKDDFQLARQTMGQLIEELNSSHFLRIHRSLLVNSYFIRRIFYLGNNEYEIELDSDVKLKSSRSYKEEIENYQSQISD